METLKIPFQLRTAKEIYIIKYFLSKSDFGFNLINSFEDPEVGNKKLLNLALYTQYEHYDANETVFKLGKPIKII